MDTSRGDSRTVLLGDSHLAKIRGARLAHLRVRMPGSAVVNRAVPGAQAMELLHALRRTPVNCSDEVVLSVGTNDLAPWKQVPLAVFESVLAEVMDLLAGRRAILVEPPPFDAVLQRSTRSEAMRSAEDRAPYVRVLRRVAVARGTGLITLDREGMQASDGVHLNDIGHTRVIEAITLTSRGSGRFRTIRA